MILIKYIKNDDDRGWIIGPTDDMMQVLDDNLVTLQGISGSRFVGPFYNGKENHIKNIPFAKTSLYLYSILNFLTY